MINGILIWGFNGGKKVSVLKIMHLGSEIPVTSQDLKPDSPLYCQFDDGQLLNQFDFYFLIYEIDHSNVL